MPAIPELIERADVRLTIKRYGLDASKPADVMAAYAFLWAEDHGPWLFDTPQTGPKMVAMAERVMRTAQADPALFARAVGGDEDAQKDFSTKIMAPVPGSGIETRSDEERALVEQRLREGKSSAEIQAELEGQRASASRSRPITFRTSHYGSRLSEGGLDVAAVEQFVRKDIEQSSSHPQIGRSRNVSTMFNGVRIQYRYSLRPDGSISVGTVFPER